MGAWACLRSRRNSSSGGFLRFVLDHQHYRLRVALLPAEGDHEIAPGQAGAVDVPTLEAGPGLLLHHLQAGEDQPLPARLVGQQLGELRCHPVSADGCVFALLKAEKLLRQRVP